MKILLFNKQEKTGGGIGVVTQRLKEFLISQGHQVFEIRYTNEPESREFVKVPYLIADSATFVIVPSPKSQKIVEEYLQKVKPDIVYLPVSCSTFDFFVPRICKKLNIPLMGACHTDISRSNLLTRTVSSMPFRFVLPICRRVDLLQVFSNELKEFFVKHGVPTDKIVVIPNGVDAQKYSPGRSNFKEEIKIKKGVLFAGRMTWIKNPEVLIKAFIEVADPKAKLILAGKGDLLRKLKEEYQSEKIVFLGFVKGEKMIDVIRSCDVFVLPSRYEGMSLSLLEAMSCGLTCIASDVATQKEMLKGAGISIPYGELKEKLAEELRKCLNDEKLRKKLGMAAREKVLELYSQRKVFLRIEKEFVKLANKT